MYEDTKRCREVIPSKENGGKLIIIDMVLKVDEGENDLLKTQLFLDIYAYDDFGDRKREELKRVGKVIL
ncbi:putative trans-resveratrol di-O-methyltransferase [Helianthus debilis subsp. tardiflorus]